MYVYEALIFPPMPPLFVDISTQAIVTAARVHFLGNLGPDPHGLNEHQALSIHMSTPYFAPVVLSNHLFQCHSELPLLFDFRPVIESSRRSKSQSLQTVSVTFFISHNSTTTSYTHSIKYPVLHPYVLTFAQFHETAVRRAAQAAPGIENFISSIQASS